MHKRDINSTDCIRKNKQFGVNNYKKGKSSMPTGI